MKYFILIVLFALFSCDKKPPKDKAYDYIWYLDAFYFDITDEQENRLKSIVDYYFEQSKPVNKVNQKVYASVIESLKQNATNLETDKIYELLIKRRRLQEPIIKSQLVQINEFFKSLSNEQKKELKEKIESFKNKSARFKFMLGQD
tara:strand:- start:8191 stop:8628 length:438 start_codon:yes stop_codon:yes gene_type:complete